MKTEEHVRIEYPNGIVFEPDSIPLDMTDEARDILNKFDDIFCIEDYMSSQEEYEKFLWILIHSMEYGFEHKEFREYPVGFKFYDDPEEPVHYLQFRHFISNAILWMPMVEIMNNVSGAKLDESLIINAKEMVSLTAEKVCDWLDEHYTETYMPYMDARKYSRSIANTEFFMSQEAVVFLPFMGLSINLEVFIDMAKRMPRYKELLYFKLDTNKQPSEMEKDAKEAEEEHRSLILGDKEFNPMKFLIHAIKGGQLRELHTIIGCKADDDGNTISQPINTNYLVGSLDNIVYYYINGIGGRKAAVYNKEYMGSTGYLLNQVVSMASTVKFSRTVEDCHSANPIPYKIRDKRYLTKMHGRYYRYPGEVDYHVVNADQDDFLIGETIYVRDPITCAAHDGVCPICYGKLHQVNKVLNSPGAYGATIVMNPVTQSIMEVKHFQTTESEIIEFSDEFNMFFRLAGDEIGISQDIDFIEDYMLVIRKNDLTSVDIEEDMESLFTFCSMSKRARTKKKNEEEEDDGDFGIKDLDETDNGENETMKILSGLRYYTTKFEVKRIKKKKGEANEPYRFEELSNKELYMHIDLINRLKTGSDEDGDFYYIPLEDISIDEFIFMIGIENKEKSRAAKQIKELINTKKHDGYTTIEDFAQRFLDLIVEAGHDAAAVQMSMIVYKLVRRKDNRLKRPDFRRIIMSTDYEIMSLMVALKNDPSITVSISNAFLKWQLVNSQETFEKKGTSDKDWLFRSTLRGRIKCD